MTVDAAGDAAGDAARDLAAAEVRAAFELYETALVSNDLAALDGFFWASPDAVRFGVGENLYGADEIAAFRRRVKPGSVTRTPTRVHLVAHSSDTVTVWAETEDREGKLGRQSQVWFRMSEGWRIVAAHVSNLPR